MTTTELPRTKLWGRRLLALTAAAALGVGGAIVVTPAEAAGTERDAISGSFNWGVKQSFRSYIASPIAHGGWTVDGASDSAGIFGFGLGDGTGDTATPAVEAAFTGSVHFTGHDEGAGPLLDVLISNPSIDTATSTLYVDVVSKGFGGGADVNQTGVAFATVDLATAPITVSGDTLTVTSAPASLTAAGATAFAGFYTAGTALDPVSFAVTLAPEKVWTPSVSVSRTTDLVAAGEQITVTGTGFDPTILGTRPPLNGIPAGVYVVVGKFSPVWKPSEGAPTSARKVIDQKWAAPGAPAALAGNAQYIPLNDDGTFTATLNAATIIDGPADGIYGVYTYPASGGNNPAQELTTPITFAVPPTTTEPTTTETTTSTTETTSTTDPTTTSTTETTSTTSTSDTTSTSETTSTTSTTSTSTPGTPVVVSGDLNWGVKSSFRSYISGAIAKGGWTVTNATDNTAATGTFGFGSIGGTLDAGVLNAAFAGTVHFTGHDSGSGPLLDLKITDPYIVASGNTGTLYLDVKSKGLSGPGFDGTDVPFATIDLTGQSLSPVNTVVSITGAPATLTAEGAVAFAGFYPAGTALDPISLAVTIGDAGSTTPTSPPVTDTQAPTNTSTAPTAAGPDLTVAALTPGTVPQGSAGSATAAGFTPGELVEAWIHSDPVKVATVTAAADGTVVVSYTVPKTLPAGAHTLILTGLTSGHQAGAALIVTAAGPAAVTGGQLNWGVSATFRAYVSGSIAKGGWSVSAGAGDNSGIIGFPARSGSFDDVTGALEARFSGSVLFTGHDYGQGPLLSLTISNPRVVAQGNSGTLYVDVRSKGLDSPDVNLSGVAFASLNLRGFSLTPVNGVISLSGVPATLTSAGASAFAGFYEAGKALDPVSLRVTLGGPGSAAAAGSLPTTGVSNIGSMAGLAAGLMLLGGVLVLSARRRGVRPARQH